MTTTQKTRNHPDACDWDDPERDAWHAEMESRPPTPCVECGAPIGYFDGTCPNGHVPPGNQGALVGRDDVRPERSNPDGGGRKAHRTDEPTPAQVSYLTSLMRDLGSDDPDAAVDAIREASLPVGDWTRKVVSGLIDTSKAAVEEKRRDERKPGGVRPNRFAGTCVLCGNNVAEGTGRIEENGGRWNTFHLDGTCPPKFVAPTHGTASTDVAAVPEGHYAIDPAEPGKNETVFYRVDRPESGQWAGRVFVKLIVGGHPDSRVPAKQAPGILARIAEAGIAESRQRYGVEIGQCAKCNRHLTDDVSRARGIGPECIKKEVVVVMDRPKIEDLIVKDDGEDLDVTDEWAAGKFAQQRSYPGMSGVPVTVIDPDEDPDDRALDALVDDWRSREAEDREDARTLMSDESVPEEDFADWRQPPRYWTPRSERES